jgi:2-polyprenyl-3-methyl-5-hydroxy-6-metoxy-1,4-benzoquinol methylase
MHKAYTELYANRKRAVVGSRPGRLSKAKDYVRSGFYAFKHDYPVRASRVQRALGALSSFLPVWADRQSAHIMGISYQPSGRLLDVGCGVGAFLSAMSDLGWTAEGLDTDPRVVESCRRNGVHAQVGTLEEANFPSESFDVVTASHVIEHIYDPVAFLAEVRRVLKVGGQVRLRTPNSDSSSLRRFRENWLGLEVPRHLYLFSPRTLAQVAQSAGFRSAVIRSTARNSYVTAVVSRELRDHQRIAYRSPTAASSRIAAYVDVGRVRLNLLAGRDVGDELLLVAQK